MPTRVLLEGPAIEPLLAQVREEYGSSVRIISADKVRSGGFGGFFAKQHYELSVEVPDPKEEVREPEVDHGGMQDAPQSLEQLLQRAESRDEIAAPPHDETQVIDVRSRRDQGREAGMGDTDAAANGAARTGGPLSNTNDAFAELMAGLDNANAIAAASAPPKPAARPSPRPKDQDQDQPETGTVRPFRPSTATGSPVNGSAPVRPLPPVPSLAELMGGLGLGDVDALSLDRPGTRRPGVSDRPGTDRSPATTDGAPRPVRSAAAAYGLAVPEPAERPLVPTPTHGPATVPGPLSATVVSGNDQVVANLISVGMPPAMAATITGGDTYAGVLSVLASRPAAPAIPDAPGDVLVLAGEVNHSLAIARSCLEELGLDQTHLLLAGMSAAGTGVHSSRVIAGPEAAEARAERLHKAESPWVVVLDAPVGGTDPGWVRETCEALGATAIWAVVDATRKTADTARHLKLLGEVEAVLVHGVDLTEDPATVLGLDLPIVSLDGKPATPHSWAALLCARIASDVVPMPAITRRPVRNR
ncbi:MAG TPA: hypothetical protein VF657_08585 [Actinoplanes sp.]